MAGRGPFTFASHRWKPADEYHIDGKETHSEETRQENSLGFLAAYIPFLRIPTNEIALIYAARQGHIASTLQLLREGHDVNVCDSSGNTPLMIAVINGDSKLMKILMMYKPNLSRRNHYNRTALLLAAEKNHLPFVLSLLDGGAGETENGYTALNVAASKNLANLASVLLNSYSHVYQIHKDNAFIDAVSHGSLEVMEVLLKSRANVNYCGAGHIPALIIAAVRGCTNTVRFLLEHNADVHLQELNGWTALIAAANEGFVDVVRVLLQYAARVDDVEQTGCTALILAVKNSHADCVEALLEHYADIDHRDEEGLSAIDHCLCEDVLAVLHRGCQLQSKLFIQRILSLPAVTGPSLAAEDCNNIISGTSSGLSSRCSICNEFDRNSVRDVSRKAIDELVKLCGLDASVVIWDNPVARTDLVIFEDLACSEEESLYHIALKVYVDKGYAKILLNYVKQIYTHAKAATAEGRPRSFRAALIRMISDQETRQQQQPMSTSVSR